MEPSEKLFVYAECQVTWTDSERKGDSNIAQPLFGLCCVRLRIYFRNGHVFALPLRCQTFSSPHQNIYADRNENTRKFSVFPTNTCEGRLFRDCLCFGWLFGGVFMQSGHREYFWGFFCKKKLEAKLGKVGKNRT